MVIYHELRADGNGKISYFQRSERTGYLKSLHRAHGRGFDHIWVENSRDEFRLPKAPSRLGFPKMAIPSVPKWVPWSFHPMERCPVATDGFQVVKMPRTSFTDAEDRALHQVRDPRSGREDLWFQLCRPNSKIGRCEISLGEMVSFFWYFFEILAAS